VSGKKIDDIDKKRTIKINFLKDFNFHQWKTAKISQHQSLQHQLQNAQQPATMVGSLGATCWGGLNPASNLQTAAAT
jgi:hypothetical protein